MLCLKKWPDTSTERKVYHWLLGRNWRRGSDRRSSETSSTSSRQRRPRQAGRSWCTNRQKIRRIFSHIFLKKQTSSLYNAIAVSIFRVSLMQCKIKCSVFSRNSEAKWYSRSHVKNNTYACTKKLLSSSSRQDRWAEKLSEVVGAQRRPLQRESYFIISYFSDG